MAGRKVRDGDADRLFYRSISCFASRNACSKGKKRMHRIIMTLPTLSIFVAASLLAAMPREAISDTTQTRAIETKAQGAMRRGLDWLAEVQNPDGSWSNPNYPALTALGLWAFTRSDHPDRDAICEQAAAFVATFAQEDGGIYKPATGGRGSGGLSTYNTAICMTALHACNKHRYAPLLLKAREFMASSQLVGDSPGAGGFGYNQPSSFVGTDSGAARQERADLSNTGWALQAMRVTQDLEDLRSGGKPVDINWAQALKFIERLQRRDPDDPENHGGFGYDPTGERGGMTPKSSGAVALRGFGSMTYAGIESMIYAQVDRNDPRVRSAIAWAARHWSVDENPGMGLRGLFYYYNLMGKALRLSGSDALRRDDGSMIEWKRELLEKIISLQKPDGSWVNTDSQFWEGDAALVTAYAILALQYAQGGLNE